jgi:hypothetical protein
MPTPCQESDIARYVVRHNPEAVYADQAGTGICATHDRALPDSITALRPFTFVTPNICDDMHSCPPTRGDTWLQTWMPRFLAVPGTRVIVTFDEGTYNNHVLTFEVGRAFRTRSTTHTSATISLLAGASRLPSACRSLGARRPPTGCPSELLIRPAARFRRPGGRSMGCVGAGSAAPRSGRPATGASTRKEASDELGRIDLERSFTHARVQGVR